MLRYLCNACKCEISLEEVAASVIVAREWGARHLPLQSALQTNGEDDYFCPEHLPLAEDYWTDKVLVCEKLAKQAASTLRNHCKDFFKRPVLRVDNESKGIPGASRTLTERSQDEENAPRQAAIS